MKEQLKKLIRDNVDVIGVFLCMFCVFAYVMFVVKSQSDLCAHAAMARDMLDGRQLFSGNFLMYFFVNFISLFSGNRFASKVALVLLIALANTGKYAIVKETFREFSNSTKVARLSALSLLFVYIIPLIYLLCISHVISPACEPYADCMYIGYVVPNVWHNSTILCMMPFAIACYLLSVKQLEAYSDLRNWYITGLLALSILVKPSFFFIYIFAYPIIIFSKYGFKKEFFRSLLPIVVGGICMVYEFLTIYQTGSNGDSSVVVEILPLFTWDFWKSRILHTVVTLLFPILFVCCYWRTIIKDREFWFVLLMLVCGFGISWCIRETGPRADHGNFMWQAFAAMWFVYYYMLKIIVLKIKTTSIGVQHMINKMILVLYSLHVIFGIIYLTKFLILKDFS